MLSGLACSHSALTVFVCNWLAVGLDPFDFVASLCLRSVLSPLLFLLVLNLSGSISGNLDNNNHNNHNNETSQHLDQTAVCSQVVPS